MFDHIIRIIVGEFFVIAMVMVINNCIEALQMLSSTYMHAYIHAYRHTCIHACLLHLRIVHDCVLVVILLYLHVYL